MPCLFIDGNLISFWTRRSEKITGSAVDFPFLAIASREVPILPFTTWLHLLMTNAGPGVRCLSYWPTSR